MGLVVHAKAVTSLIKHAVTALGSATGAIQASPCVALGRLPVVDVKVERLLPTNNVVMAMGRATGAIQANPCVALGQLPVVNAKVVKSPTNHAVTALGRATGAIQANPCVAL